MEELAKQVGVSKAYFYKLKQENPEVLEWLLSFHPEPAKSYNLAIEAMEEVRDSVHDIIYELAETYGAASKFSRYLCERGIYKHPRTFLGRTPTFFTSSKYAPLAKYRQYTMLISEYKRWKNEITTL